MNELSKSDFMPREELERLQLERLRKTCAHVRQHIPFYQRKFAESKVTENDLRSIDDIRRLYEGEMRFLRQF